MSLIAHYKLDGDAKDSLGNYDGNIVGSPSWTNGKLGLCYDNTSGANTGVELMRYNDAKKYDYTHSISFWFMSTTSNSNTGNRIFSRDFSEYGPKVGIHQDRNPNSIYYINKDIELNKWYHLVLTTKDGINYDWYINGEYFISNSEPFDGTARPWVIGGNTEGDGDISGNHFVGKIDDLRIYDHALSVKEVKELNQAKVLHYKFNDFQEPTENLISEDGINFETYSGYPSSFIITRVSDDNSPSGYAAEMTFLDNASRYGRSRFGTNTNIPNSGFLYVSIVAKVESGPSGTVKPSVYTGKTWYDLLPMDNDSIFITSTYRRFGAYVEIGTGSGGPNPAFSAAFRYGTSQGQKVRWHSPQLEKKSYATPFTNNIRNGKINDFSEQGNHANLSLNNTPKWAENSKLGGGCYEFDGDADRITTNNYINFENKSWSVCSWVKPLSSSNYTHIFTSDSSQSDFTCKISKNLEPYFYSTQGRTYVNDKKININEWSHLCYMYDGNSLKIYINGILEIQENNITLNIPNRKFRIQGGSEEYNKALHDDVRIYATALSTDEVKNIYQNKASLDNIGNLYSYEFVEPEEKVLIKEQYYTATTRLRSASPPAELDYSDWVEGDSTLGVIILEGWVYLTTTSIIPSRVEFTRVNNDEGLTFNFTSSNTKIVYPNSSWTTGWNYVTVKNPTYRSPSVTDWSNMNRLEIYKNGSNDSTQQIGFKNLKLRKNYDNQPIKKSFQNNGQVKTLEFTESSNFSKSDYLDYTQWNLNTNGSQGSFSRNGGNNENKIILYPNPWGVIVPTWQCIPDSNSNADGGWNASFNSNHTEKLRFSVFVKRTGSKNGTTYLGSENSNHTLRLNGNVNSNPYFWSGDPPNLDEWYLMVGVIHSSSYSGGDTGYAGMYDLGNNRVINFTEYKWAAGETIQEMRAYLYYCTDTDVRQYFLYPRVDIMDGTEPSINDLLQGKEMLVRHSNKGMSIFDNQIKTNHQLIE